MTKTPTKTYTSLTNKPQKRKGRKRKFFTTKLNTLFVYRNYKA